MRVGFIGLGSQGGPMARQIVTAGYPTTLWARRKESLEPYGDTAAKFAETPAELGAASDLACLCVVADTDVLEVATGENGVLSGMAPGGILAVHSTIHPDTCRKLAAEASERDVRVIDAPVSGGGGAAAEKRLLVMVGGDAEPVERARPVFETYGNPVVHLGELGAGQVTKLLNNLLFTANLATAATTMSLAESLGIDRTRLGEVITNGTANSFALGRVTHPGGLELIATHAGELLRKDVGLIAGIAGAADAEPDVVFTAADRTLELMEHPR